MNDFDYLKRCYAHAMLSNDPSTQNATIIVKNGKTIATGLNKMPMGTVGSDAQWRDRSWKYPRIIHAERNSIAHCARFGYATDGCTMYATWAACSNCAQLIIDSGIRRVVSHKHDKQIQHGSWADDILLAKQMLKDADVEFIELSGVIGQKIRFNYGLIDV